MRMASSFDNYVIKGILANNEYGIKEVNELESLKSGYFVREEYGEIEKQIRGGNVEAIDLFFKDQIKSSEFLEIMKFKDQSQHVFIVTVYDNLELWQDPQVIEIYPEDINNNGK